MADSDFWTNLEQIPTLVAQDIVDNSQSLSSINAAYIAQATTEITYESQILGPDLLTLTLIDPDWVIQTSGLCDVDDEGLLQAIDINFPKGTDVWWRLIDVTNQGGDLTEAALQLVFQHRLVSYLQADWGPLKVAPGTTTRAQFVKQMADRVPKSIPSAALGPGSLRAQQIQFICPEINVVQPLEASTTTPASTSNAKSQVNKTKGIGYGANLTVKGTEITKAQIDVCNTALNAAISLNAPEVVMVAIIYAGMGESSLGADADTWSGGGVWQDLSSPNVHDITAEADAWLTGGFGFKPASVTGKGGGLANAQIYSDAWQIANATEANKVWDDSQQDSYAHEFPGGQPQGIAEAKNIVAEYGGSSDGSVGKSGSSVISDVSQLTRGTADNPDEDSWTCMQRLAQEVNWELFTTARAAEGNWGNYLYYRTGPNNDKQMPSVYVIRSDRNPGTWDLKASTQKATMTSTNALTQQPTYTFDNTAFLYQTTKKKHGKVQRSTRIAKPQTPSQCQLMVVSDPFEYNAGEVVVFQNSGPLNGRWIVTDNTRNILGDLFNQLTLAPPTAPNAEPTATSTTKAAAKNAAVSLAGGDVLSKVVSAAQTAVQQASKYGYDQHRPMDSTLFGAVPRMMDCSAFVTLCYKAAGGPDPNGLKFNGQGSSFLMTSNCTKISQGDAQAGDLVIFPDHVVIYTGGGNCISQGGPPGFPSGPKEETVKAEAAFDSRGVTGYYRVPGV